MKLIMILLFALVTEAASSQPKEFEGIVTYQTEIKSKNKNLTDDVMKIILAQDNNTKTYIKQGNYLQSNMLSDVYFLTGIQKCFIKFRNIDTLYTLNYSDDTTRLLGVSKSDQIRTIAGFECRSIELKQSKSTVRYYYCPSLYANPEFDKNNTLANYNAYTKETSSIWLASEEEAPGYRMALTAIKVEPKKLSDETFKLPNLPQTSYLTAQLLQSPVYKQEGDWNKYIETNLNSELGSKYIKLKKGETSSRQSAKVQFIVNKNGQVENAVVLNSRDIHSKLSEEALRVVNNSGRWKPATINGEKIDFVITQQITFEVTN